jgi:hypothetical protein
MVQQIKRTAMRQISGWQGSLLGRLSPPNTINDASDTRMFGRKRRASGSETALRAASTARPRANGRTASRNYAALRVVVFQKTAEPFVAQDLADGLTDILVRVDEAIADSLVRAFRMIMGAEILNCVAQHVLPEENHPVQTLLLDGPHEPFREGVQVGRPRRQSQRFHPRLA